jgi:hypothetical protein
MNSYQTLIVLPTKWAPALDSPIFFNKSCTIAIIQIMAFGLLIQQTALYLGFYKYVHMGGLTNVTLLPQHYH